MIAQQHVDRIPGQQSFLTVTDSALEVIRNIAKTKPQGCFSILADIGAHTTTWRYEWRDQFTDQDYIVDIQDQEIVLDATTIAYILDEYTLDYVNTEFRMMKHSQGPLRHRRG